MTDQSYPGFAGPVDADALNSDQFRTKHQLARLRTGVVVKVVAVYPGNGADTPTTLDVQPMVDQVDPGGNRTPHGTIYGIVQHRIHGGGNAILIDAEVGDVGFMVCADRDISEVLKSNGQQSAPGSMRRHDMSDAVYHGGLWTAAPTNVVDLRGGNISIASPGNIAHTAGGTIAINATGGFTMGSHADVVVKPNDPSKKVYLGGDPANGGTFAPVTTASGPSDNVLAHISGPI